MKSEALSDTNFLLLSERIEGVLELLLKQNNEIVAVSITSAATPGTGYHGVIYFKGQP